MIFRLSLDYGCGSTEPTADAVTESDLTASSLRTLSFRDDSGSRIDLEWPAGDDEDQVALRLHSQLLVALPSPRDSVIMNLSVEESRVRVDMQVMKRREPLRSVTLSKVVGSGQPSEGIGVLTKLIAASFVSSGPGVSLVGFEEHWKSLMVLSLCDCGLSVIRIDFT